jgi:hypothetical protein
MNLRCKDGELYALHESNHALCREQVTWASVITHPDAWMMPVLPGQEADGTQTVEKCSAPALATPSLKQPLEPFKRPLARLRPLAR